MCLKCDDYVDFERLTNINQCHVFLYFQGIFYWLWSEKGEVDRASCECSCFDTVFRGKIPLVNTTNKCIALYYNNICVRNI